MKDLDAARRGELASRLDREERDRSFKIGGEEFTIRAAVSPKAILRWNKLIAGEYVVKDERGIPIRDPEPALLAARNLLKNAKPSENGHAEVSTDALDILARGLESSVPVSTIGEEEGLAIYEETVLAYLEPGQEEKWARVSGPDAAHPLSDEDYQAIIMYAIEVTSGRPTGPPSGSSSKPGGDGTTSTEGSSSPEVVGSAV